MSNNWKDRIYNHEEIPPKGIWDSIAQELDKQDKEKQGEQQKAKIIGITTIKWAVAAAVLVAVVATSVYLFNTKPQISTSAQTEIKQTPATPNKVTPTTPTNSTVDIAIEQKPVKQQHKKNLTHTTSTEELTLPESIDIVTSNTVVPNIKDPITANNTKLKNIAGETTDDINMMDAPNSYVSFLGPNGQEIRVSSKFANLIGLLRNGEHQEYLDKVISESAFWKEKFSKWRNKMSEIEVSPSPLNFFDIIELTKLLSEEK